MCMKVDIITVLLVSKNDYKILEGKFRKIYISSLRIDTKNHGIF